MTIEDMAATTAERMRVQLESRPNAYADDAHEIRLTISTLEALHQLLTVGRQRSAEREITAAQSARRRIENAPFLIGR